MSGDAGGRLIRRLERRWRSRLETSGLLIALAAALQPAALAVALRPAPISRGLGWAALALLAGGGVAALVVAWRRTRREAILRHLDRVAPPLEESAELLAGEEDELSPLAALQRRRLLQRIDGLEERQLLPRAPLRRALVVLLVSALVGALIVALVPRSLAEPRSLPGRGSAPAPGATAPRVTKIEVAIRPPRYTGLAVDTTSGLELTAPEGSEIEWSVWVGGAAERVVLVFDAVDELELRPVAGAGVMAAAATVTADRVYELRLEEAGGTVWRSGYARLSVTPDRPPALRWVRPEPVVELQPDDPLELALAIEVADDYGLEQAEVVATLTTGAGESVRFRERRLPLPLPTTGRGEALLLERRLDLAALGMEPGAELYYHVEAVDGRRPSPRRGRSAANVVRVAGGAGASVGLGEGLPIVRLPEFFRSQRQIILDTEKLLAERQALTDAEVVRRSENLGFEQRALRMRYAGLLGEEFESGLPPGARPRDDGDEEHEHGDGMGELGEMGEMGAGEPAEGSISEALAALPEGFVHSHDSAEIATYFDSEVRAQLKQAMEEMWGSEGRLRSIDPQASLPYQYRALKLLKSAQEAERVYVRKVGFEPPPLLPDEKRLSGDLDEVRSRRRVASPPVREPAPAVRRALEALDRLDGDREGSPVAAELEAVRGDLAKAASASQQALAGLDLLEEVLGALEASRRPAADDVAALRDALIGLLPEPGALPTRERRPGELYRAYAAQLEENR